MIRADYPTIYDFVKKSSSDLSYPFYHVFIEQYSMEEAIEFSKSIGVDLKSETWKFPTSVHFPVNFIYRSYEEVKEDRKKLVEKYLEGMASKFPMGFPFCSFHYLDGTVFNCFSPIRTANPCAEILLPEKVSYGMGEWVKLEDKRLKRELVEKKKEKKNNFKDWMDL